MPKLSNWPRCGSITPSNRCCVEQVELRQAIEKQLNRIELANGFTHAVMIGNPNGLETEGWVDLHKGTKSATGYRVYRHKRIESYIGIEHVFVSWPVWNACSIQAAF